MFKKDDYYFFVPFVIFVCLLIAIAIWIAPDAQ